MLTKCEMINVGVEQRLSLVYPEMSATEMETALRQKRRRYTSQPVHNQWKCSFFALENRQLFTPPFTCLENVNKLFTCRLREVGLQLFCYYHEVKDSVYVTSNYFGRCQ
jgi:hypothetical protein